MICVHFRALLGTIGGLILLELTFQGEEEENRCQTSEILGNDICHANNSSKAMGQDDNYFKKQVPERHQVDDISNEETEGVQNGKRSRGWHL